MSNHLAHGRLDCPSCGEATEAGSRFCGACGAALWPGSGRLMGAVTSSAASQRSVPDTSMNVASSSAGDEKPGGRVARWESLKQWDRDQRAAEKARFAAVKAADDVAGSDLGRSGNARPRYPFPRSEKRVLRAITAGQVLLLASLFTPWWRYRGEFLWGDDAKSTVFLVLLASVFVLIMRFKTPVRPMWLYGAFGAISILGLFGFNKMPGGQGDLSLSVFGYFGVLGILVLTVASMTGLIVALRNDQRLLGSLLAASKPDDENLSAGSWSNATNH
jgi:hypothetical protein